ncbi:MAG: serine/threonine-protein kinase, partial [Deltaproteobacteria bacterium]|nr:serine/threonine-protein kinase [Deltaproteobacteria bacterium]
MVEAVTGSQMDSEIRTAFIDPHADAKDDGARLVVQEPEIGALQGRYVVLEKIGRGAMGCVLRAYDPKLQREVALKIVSGWTLDPHARERMMREAQAMAQLSHPHVVALHDVEESEVGVVLVMEFICGQTMRRWTVQAERPWQEIVAHMLQAGRGLAAAHDAGLLHRDFKPENVLVADTGTVKVTDFGLAKVTTPRSLSGDSHTELPLGPGDSMTSSALDVALTRVGAVVGTPRYMAPEQHRGQDLGPAADQYAFCVSLWEALTGEPPHRAKSTKALLREKLQGPPPWPSQAPGLPSGLVDALRRGLAPEPAERFATMELLLAALDHDPRRQRNRWLAAFGGIGLVGAIGLGGWSWSMARTQTCAGAREHLAGVWDEAVATDVRTAMLGSGGSFTGPAWERTRAELDRYADAWTAMHTEACEATAVRAEQSTQMLDLRMGCLHRARLELEAVTAVLTNADLDVTRNAADVVGSLSSLDRCADTKALSADVDPPTPEQAEVVARIRKHLAEADAEAEAGRYSRSQQLVEEAERALAQTDYGPVVTEVEYGVGGSLDYLGRYEDAAVRLHVALESAARWRQWDLMQEIAEELVFVVGCELRRMAEGRQLWTLSLGLAMGDPLREASARNSFASVLMLEGKLAEAEAEYRRGLELRQQSPHSDDVEIAISMGNLAQVLTVRGEYDAAEIEIRRGMALVREALGPDHPTVALFLNNLAQVLTAQAKNEEAEASLRRALELMEEALGSEHPEVALAMGNLAMVLYAQGKLDESESLTRQALAIRERVLEPGHHDIGHALNSLANILHGQARYAEAEVELHKALEILENVLGPEHADVAQSRSNLGLMLNAQGQSAAAEVQMRKALSIWQRALGPDHTSVGIGHNNLALIFFDAGRLDEA